MDFDDWAQQKSGEHYAFWAHFIFNSHLLQFIFPSCRSLPTVTLTWKTALRTKLWETKAALFLAMAFTPILRLTIRMKMWNLWHLDTWNIRWNMLSILLLTLLRTTSVSSKKTLHFTSFAATMLEHAPLHLLWHSNLWWDSAGRQGPTIFIHSFSFLIHYFCFDFRWPWRPN